MTKVCVDLFSRPVCGLSIPERRNQFLNRLSQQKLHQDWLFKPESFPELTDEPGQLSDGASVSKLLPSSVTGQVHFVWSDSTYLRDEGRFDDRLFIKFNSKKYELKFILQEVLPGYISALQCYSGGLYIEDHYLPVMKNRKVFQDSHGVKFDRRHALFNFNQVNFFDQELCFRAFGKSLDEVEALLSGNVELVKKVGGGILIGDQLDSYLESVDHLKKHDEKLRSLLGLEIYWK